MDPSISSKLFPVSSSCKNHIMLFKGRHKRKGAGDLTCASVSISTGIVALNSKV